MRLIVMLGSLLLAAPSISFAQEWRGIKPLRSTCEDVKRALGVDKCDYPRSIYRLKDETVTISFETCPCPVVCYHQSGGWNVPPGTVGSIIRQLHNPLPVADFNVDNGKWKTSHTDFIGQVIYDNRGEGVTLSAIEGAVVTITYYPPLDKHKDLLCPKCSAPPPPNAKKDGNPSSWFSAYGGVTFDEEKKRLDEFARKLHDDVRSSKGYIVAYDGCGPPKGEAKARAERAKEYLVGTQGIDSSRIMTIEGGQREEMLIELHIRARDMPPPRTFSSSYPKDP